MLDYLRDVGERPAWQPVPARAKELLRSALPVRPMDLESVYREFAQNILPYPTGNIHPRFFGWVHGSGTPVGALADFLAATMNANLGGREHAAVYVEREVIAWFCELFGFGSRGSGIVLSGTSIANFAGVLVARTAKCGRDGRARGLDQVHHKLVGYASGATHGCVRKAFEMAGLGGDALRIIETDAEHRIDVAALERAIAQDRAAANVPFLLVGNAGTVDCGAIDPLENLADVAGRNELWFHVDGAFGALAALSEKLRPALRGIERAGSIAFDFHKWLHVPYDAACLLVRDEAVHRETFASEGPYITRMSRGTAAGAPWFADFGPDLSRGFRALKVWFTLKVFGSARLAQAIEMNCAQAGAFAGLLREDPRFEIAAPVPLNIVCFRLYNGSDEQADNLAVALQESGQAVISSTTVDGRRALRACFTNHRTTEGDVRAVYEALRKLAPST